MALKFTVDKLDDVPALLREHYTKVGDKFQLATEGAHPKVEEFRETNVRLMAELEPLKAKAKQFEGIDPATIAADKAKLAELESTKTLLAARDTELATEKAARTAAQAKADRALLRDTISGKAIKAGVRADALDILLDKSELVFGVVGDVVKAKTAFSKARPAESLSVDEWLGSAIKEFPFLWQASSGGGAAPRSNLFGGGHVAPNVLRDPTPAQLGQHADAIRSGKMKVEYSE